MCKVFLLKVVAYNRVIFSFAVFFDNNLVSPLSFSDKTLRSSLLFSQLSGVKNGKGGGVSSDGGQW